VQRADQFGTLAKAPIIGSSTPRRMGRIGCTKSSSTATACTPGSTAPRVVVIQFESLEKLQALYESAPYKQAVAIGDKYATQRIFGLEGVLP
jgi:Domain of unknown function (DUF1330)